MPNFDVKTSSDGDWLVVTLSGECDLSVQAELASALADAVSRSAAVVVDLAALTFLDSSGIHELVTAHHAARDRNGHLALRNATGMVATVLEVTGVGELLSPRASDADATGSPRD
jgi:anti-sigma B factor antagonist